MGDSKTAETESEKNPVRFAEFYGLELDRPREEKLQEGEETRRALLERVSSSR